MDKRIGVIGIIVEDRKKAPEINSLLSSYGHLIIGRMGIPRIDRAENEVSVISLIIEGSTDEVGALTGKLGNIRGIQVRSALSK